MLSASERREQIMDTLCFRREEKIENLAKEFRVSERTIRTDIEILTCKYPIETKRGRYGGGVKVAEGFRRDRSTLTKEEGDLLKKLSLLLEGHELDVMNGIVRKLALS